MELARGQVAVVTGAASGIGLALANAFAARGLVVVIADVEEERLATAADEVGRHGVDVLTRRTDVSREEEVAGLAAATLERFGRADVVCNNAGVAARADAWFGPLSSWEWVMGVNFWGVVHGMRAFLPQLVAQGGGHIVNTASIAGLYPGFGASYDASKHAVVAVTEGLYVTLRTIGLPVGVSCLCPGWVRTDIIDSDRNWPTELGDLPPAAPLAAVTERHVRRAIDEGMTPAAVADHVLAAVTEDRFWVFPHGAEFLDVVVERWHQIAEQRNPEPPEEIPGMPPRSELVAEMLAALGMAPAAAEADGSASQ
jgi:NAD(P)-dependent dehydrogenase (short-subunit alcohol dehydrogenase family)